MEKLCRSIGDLKNSKLKQTIDSRIAEFKESGQKSSNEIFSELCFCLLTANFNAEKSIKIQKEIGSGFITLSQKDLEKKLADLGHRNPERRAGFIVEARKYKDSIKNILRSFKNESDAREWLAGKTNGVKNVKGLGYKEASHFLRNIGYENLAIIDFHIIDLLVKCGLVERPKTLTPKKYLEIEKTLREIAKRSGLDLAELDLYLWYMETGKILK
jgi:N-glycosylase/DNA lyase